MRTRDCIVDAAMTIVRRDGVSRLTLDEAARVAGLSKGGVLYHFKSKDALIGGMIGRQIERCDALAQRYYDAESEGAYRWVRALIRVVFDPHSPTNDLVNGALLAVVATNQTLMAPIKAMYQLWDQRLESDAPDPERAELISLALDGIFYQKMMGLGSFDAAKLDRLRAHALALVAPPTERVPS